MENIEVFKMAMLEKGISISKIADLIRATDEDVKHWLCGFEKISQEKMVTIADFLGINRNNAYNTNFLQRIDSVDIIQVVAIKKFKRENTQNSIGFVETEYWDLSGNKIGKSI